MNIIQEKPAGFIEEAKNVSEVMVEQPVRHSSPPATMIIISGIVFLFIAAESWIALASVFTGVVLVTALIFGLANLSFNSKTHLERQLYMALTLPPLLRFMSLAMPVWHVPPILEYVLVGFPLLISVTITLRAVGLRSLRINLTLKQWISQLCFGLFGILLGVYASFIMKPKPILPNNDPFWRITGGLILTLFSGFTEEVIFRGLLQKALSVSMGFWGFALSNLIFISMFVGTLSPLMVVYFGVTGLFFALWADISDSIWGVIMAHSLMNILFFLVLV